MVEWKKLEEVFELRNGYTPSKNHPEFWEGGTIPWFRMEDIRQNGHILDDSIQHITPESIKKSGLFPANTIIVATTATIGEHALVIVDSLANQRFTALIIRKSLTQSVLPRFAYYCCFRLDNWCKNHIHQGGFASVDMEGFKKFPFPIPSLSEQTRIVGILDTFTAAIENLKEQIAQRRKQYEWYLDKAYFSSKLELINALNRGLIQVKTLDDVGSFTRGRRFVRTDIVSDGIPCIHYGDMYTYYGVWTEKTPTYLTKEKSEKLRFAKYGDVIIVGAGENDIDIGVGVAWLGKENVVVHDACYIFEHNMNAKYLSYFMRSNNYHQQIRMGVVDGKICSISAKELGRTLIPVPSLSEQSRIVSILDTFEASIQNLEAQLKEREKQYEYYRNKLLTFEKAE
ncbi:MAG: restriction endonuclease subunit S [Prevotella sp.]|nr:restriction endonuclease subunit S [Prevotella sp.]